MVVGDRKSSQSQKVFIALAAAFFVFYYLPVAATAQHITIKATDASKNQQCDFPIFTVKRRMFQWEIYILL